MRSLAIALIGAVALQDAHVMNAQQVPDSTVLLQGNVVPEPSAVLLQGLDLDEGTMGITCSGDPCAYKGDCTDSTHKCCQDELFRLLDDTVDFLEANEIEYYIMSGTLLGALREQDIIPYTADVDLAMRRPGIEKLVANKDSVVSYGPDARNDKIFRACFKANGTSSRAFSSESETLPYIDIYDIDLWPEFKPYKRFFKGSNKALIRGRKINIPKSSTYILGKMYGKDWHTAVEGRGLADLKSQAAEERRTLDKATKKSSAALDIARKETKAAQKAVKELKDELATTRKASDKAAKQASSELDAASKEADAARAEAQAAREKNEKLAAELAAALNKSDAAAKTASAALDVAREEAKAAREAADKLSGELAAARLTSDDANKKAKAAFDSARKKAEAARGEAKAASEKNEELEAELGAMRQSASEASKATLDANIGSATKRSTPIFKHMKEHVAAAWRGMRF